MHTYDEVRRREGGMGLLEKLMYKQKLEVGEAFLALLLEPEILIEKEYFDFKKSSSRVLYDQIQNPRG